MLTAPPILMPVQSTSSLQHEVIQIPDLQNLVSAPTVSIPEVPFYSQFKDISAVKWQKVGCGIASLAMLIEYYNPDSVSVDTLLKQGIASGAYQKNAGWTHKGLIQLSKKYGLDGKSYDLSSLSTKVAYARFADELADGPVMASIHYKFDPKNPIPHLVVIDGIKDGIVYYNDPASNGGEKQITVAKFLGAWKKKFIIVRPTAELS